MTIRVLSFDFDGCLFHNKYMESDNKDVIFHNSIFLQTIKNKNNDYEHIVVFIGSNRQSKAIDDRYIIEIGSCFSAVQDVSTYFGATLDKLLLADVYGELPAGTSFNRAIDLKYQGEHSDYLFDATKLTLLYAQMHKVALQNPSDHIEFDFYDDRNFQEDECFSILASLGDFFSNNLDLIPNNITLRLNHYAGLDVSVFATFSGTGVIDTNYRQTVKEMAQLATNKEFSGDGVHSFLNTCFHVKSKFLTNIKPLNIGASERFFKIETDEPKIKPESLVH